jgi:hypothetical protein
MSLGAAFATFAIVDSIRARDEVRRTNAYRVIVGPDRECELPDVPVANRTVEVQVQGSTLRGRTNAQGEAVIDLPHAPQREATSERTATPPRTLGPREPPPPTAVFPPRSSVPLTANIEGYTPAAFDLIAPFASMPSGANAGRIRLLPRDSKGGQ